MSAGVESDERPSGALRWFVLALVLSPAVLFSLYLEVAASIDRAYRSAQLVQVPVASVLGYALLGLAGPVASALVLAACGSRRWRRLRAATTVALCAELAALAVGLGTGFWLLNSGVT